MPTHAINWFEIPTVDIERAIRFYSAILDKPMQRDDIGMPYSFLPTENGGVGGALIQNENFVPSDTGAVIYLNGGDDLQVVLDRVEGAGGKIIMQKMEIGENGFVAMFIDTEGNRVGLHSNN